MKTMLPIIKKELRRYFTDKRLLAALILPGVMIYILYSLMGGVMADMFSVDEEFVYNIHVVNQSEKMQPYFELPGAPNFNFTIISEEELEDSKLLIKSKEIELIVVYDDSFNSLLDGDMSEYGNVELYYNYDYIESSVIYSIFNNLFSYIQSELVAPAFGVNQDEDTVYELVDEQATSSIFTMMLPMLLMTFLCTGVMSVATESIEGEKERGTIAALLITPVSRVKLACAKIIAITFPALLSALISFIGVVASLPKMLEGSDTNMNMGVLSFFDYFSLLITIVFTVLVSTVLLTMISTFAKSIKESSQLSSPYMIIVVMCGLMASFMPISNQLFLIPILNSALMISNVFGGTLELTHLLLFILSNFTFVSVGVFLVARMFNNENIMFSK